MKVNLNYGVTIKHIRKFNKMNNVEFNRIVEQVTRCHGWIALQ